MDRFAEVTHKISRMSKPSLLALLFIVIVVLALFSYLAPVWGRLHRVYSVRSEVSALESITSAQARDYLARLESDPALLAFLAGDEKLNVVLLRLYLQVEDYDAVIARADLAYARKATHAYDSYLATAYEKKMPAYRAHYDAGLSAFYERRFDDALREFDAFAAVAVAVPLVPEVTAGSQQQISELKADARLQQEAIAFVRPFDAAVMWGNLGEVETAQLAVRAKTDPPLADFSLRHGEYNSLLERYYLQQGDYDQVIAWSERAQRIEDLPLYHYFRGLAYDKTGKTAAAVAEMKTFLAAPAEQKFAAERDAAHLYLATHFATQGAYGESIRYQAAIIRERSSRAGAAEAELYREAVAALIDRKAYKLTAPDSDHDGLSDSFEGVLGTDARSADTDGDKTKDGDELLRSRDPRRSAADDLLSDQGYSEIYVRLIAR